MSYRYVGQSTRVDINLMSTCLRVNLPRARSVIKTVRTHFTCSEYIRVSSNKKCLVNLLRLSRTIVTGKSDCLAVFTCIRNCHCALVETTLALVANPSLGYCKSEFLVRFESSLIDNYGLVPVV